MILQNIQKPIPVGQKHLATIKLDESKEKRIGNFENLTKIWIKTQTDRKVQSSHLLRLSFALKELNVQGPEFNLSLPYKWSETNFSRYHCCLPGTVLAGSVLTTKPISIAIDFKLKIKALLRNTDFVIFIFLSFVLLFLTLQGPTYKQFFP